MNPRNTYYRVTVIFKPHREKAREVKRSVNVQHKAAADLLVEEFRGRRGFFAVAEHMALPEIVPYEVALTILHHAAPSTPRRD